MKGIIVGILENKYIGNCSLGGISSKVRKATLVGEGIPELYIPHDEAPAIRLVKRQIMGKEYVHCEPIKNMKDGRYIMGGCFVWSSDNRFPNDYPLPLHDRVE